MMKFVAANSEKVKEYAKRFFQGHWTFLGLGEENWFGTLPYAPEGKWHLTVTQMVERFKDTRLPVFKSISVLSRGILNKKNGRDIIHCNADASNTELFFPNYSFCKTAQYLRSSFELVVNNSDWQRKNRNNNDPRGMERIRDQKTSYQVRTQLSRSKTFGILSKTCIWKQFAEETFRTSNHCPGQFDSLGVCELTSFRHRVSVGFNFETQLDEDDGFGQVDSIMPRIHAFSSKLPIQSLCSNSRSNK